MNSGSIPTPDDQLTVVDQSTTVDEENTSTDIITAMLAIYKFVNRNKTTGQNVQILPADGSINDVGILLTNNPNDEIISITPIDYTFVMTVNIAIDEISIGLRSSTNIMGDGKYNVSQNFQSVNDDTGRADTVTKRREFKKKVKELTLTDFLKSQPGGTDINGLKVTPIKKFKVTEVFTAQSETNSTIVREDITSKESKYKDQFKPTYTNVYTKRFSENKISIENPLKDFGWNDAFKLLTQPPLPHYIRFGALLEFLLANVLIKIKKTGEPIFKIDHDEWGTYMYSLPNQISLDPRVCIVRNDHIEVGFSGKQTQSFTSLNYFREYDGPDPSKENSALTLNIYLNFDFVTECLKTDDKGNVSVYQFLSNICTGLNKALGGINNLEPVIDETNNTLRIIDTTPIPGHSADDNGPGYILQIYGYDKLGNNFISNFVRKVDLKTAITPEYATMITVGATAGGYVKGTEATAFSKWNTGLTDRFKEEFLPPNGTSANSNENEADDNYVKTFIIDGYANRYGLTYLGEGMKFSDNIIEKNISIVTEYYKWLIAKESIDKDKSGGTVGFIPFKLGLTLDGISGIKIYNVLRINTEFLPKAYGKTVDLIVTGVSHRLDNNDWETSIESTVMPKPGNTKLSTISEKEVRENIAPLRKEIEEREEANDRITSIVAGTPSGTYIPFNSLSKKSQNFVNSSDRITLVREWTTSKRTSGTLWYNGKVLGFTVEDPIREKKIKAKTAIPKGNFNLTLDSTGNSNLTRCYVTFPGEKNPFKSPGVFPRVGTSKNAVNLEASNLSFAGIRIHNGTSEGWSAGCIIYSSVRNKDGTIKNDVNHNKALTQLIYNNKIKLITVTHEWENK